MRTSLGGRRRDVQTVRDFCIWADRQNRTLPRSGHGGGRDDREWQCDGRPPGRGQRRSRVVVLPSAIVVVDCLDITSRRQSRARTAAATSSVNVSPCHVGHHSFYRRCVSRAATGHNGQRRASKLFGRAQRLLSVLPPKGNRPGISQRHQHTETGRDGSEGSPP